MPNYCNYDMHVEGKKKNILTLIDYLSAEYHYCNFTKEGKAVLETPECYVEYSDNERRNVAHHIGGRVFNCFYDDYMFETVSDDDKMTVYLSGDCAWSVSACMFANGYYGDLMKEYGDKCKSITILQACQDLDLKVEIFSSEPGMCFSEHYCIDNEGNCFVDEQTELYEVLVDEYETYDDYVKDYQENGWEVHLSEEQFDNAVYEGECVATVCDFMEEGSYQYCYVS